VGLGPTHGGIDRHAAAQVFLEVGVGLGGENRAKGIHGFTEHIARQLAIIIPLELPPDRVGRGVINTGEFQCAGIDQC